MTAYAQIKNGIATELSNATTVWDANNYCPPDALWRDGRAEPFGVVPLVEVSAPTYDPLTHFVARDGCELTDGQWQQKWAVTPLTQEQIDSAYKATIPQSVTMRQARLALLGAGLLPAVTAAIASMPEPERTAAQITWEFAATVDRSFGMVPALASAMGMTETQIDALFTAAAQL